MRHTTALVRNVAQPSRLPGHANHASLSTAGLAYGRVQSDYTLNIQGVPPASAHFKDVKAGWTAGAGVEFAWAQNWSSKLEYLYMDLGTNEATISAAGVALAVNRRFSDHIVRFGLNYRFGGGGLGF